MPLIEALDERRYAVSSAEGEFTLTIYPAGSSLEPPRYIHWVLKTLEGLPLSFKIAVPKRDARGATLHQPANGDSWSLMPYFVGDTIQPNDPDHAYAIGNGLGELHSMLSRLPPLPRPDYRGYDFRQRTLPNTLRKLPNQPDALGLSETPESVHRTRRFAKLAQAYQTQPPPPDQNIHWHLIHGDFFGASLIYDGDRLTSVQGFDFARPDYRAREFAETLMRVAADRGTLFWATARPFAEGYADYLVLSREEIDLIPEFIVAYQVDMVMTFAGYQPAEAAKALMFQEEISAWVEAEGERLLAMLRGVFLGE